MAILAAENLVSAATAEDVLLRIVHSHKEVSAIHAVVYEEGPNWRDERMNAELTTGALERALRQDVHPRSIIQISRTRVLGGHLQRLQEQLSVHQLLGVSSRVSIGPQRTRHIPIMDFRCEISSQNENLLRSVLPSTGQAGGYILNSGRSYHFYGTRLLTAVEWRKFLGKCLLLRDLVDERYIGHQLVDGYCVLRLSASAVKPSIPRVVVHF